MSQKRVMLIANKWWEADPLCWVLFHSKARPSVFSDFKIKNYPTQRVFNTADLKGIKASFTEKTPTKAISNFLVILSVLFYFLWLSEIVPALFAGEIPQSVKDVETPTNAIHVLDMAWILPAMGLTAIWLRRKQEIGYVYAGALLTYVTLMILAIMSMVVLMIKGGHPVVIGQIVIFGVLLIINSAMSIWYLKEMR